MAKKPVRLLPPLLHVFRDAHRKGDAKKPLDLRDEEGARIITGRRGMTRQPVNETVLRKEVATNLSSLLNTVHLEANDDFAGLPRARRSILNYGIPDLAKLTIDEDRVRNVTVDIRRAILAYEPRLIPESIAAVRDDTIDAASLQLRFLVRGDLRCEPLNVPVEFVAAVDRDGAKFRIDRL